MIKKLTLALISGSLIWGLMGNASPVQAGPACTSGCTRFLTRVFQWDYSDDNSVNGSNGNKWLWIIGGIIILGCLSSTE